MHATAYDVIEKYECHCLRGLTVLFLDLKLDTQALVLHYITSWISGIYSRIITGTPNKNTA